MVSLIQWNIELDFSLQIGNGFAKHDKKCFTFISRDDKRGMVSACACMDDGQQANIVRKGAERIKHEWPMIKQIQIKLP